MNHPNLHFMQTFKLNFDKKIPSRKISLTTITIINDNNNNMIKNMLINIDIHKV
jgi:hypothetical protein